MSIADSYVITEASKITNGSIIIKNASFIDVSGITKKDQEKKGTIKELI